MLRVLLLALGLALAPFSAAAQTRLLSEDNNTSVAVIVANKNYRYASRFPVEYAHNDAAAIKDYLVRFLRFDERNIIVEIDATKTVLDGLFQPEGRLWARVRDRSNVFVFYSGHGVPDPVGRQAYLLPVDVEPDSPQQGYALETLYQSLDLIKQRIGPDRHVIVMIDACFSGETGRGERFVSGTSAPGFQPARPRGGNGLVKLVATSGTHPANWDETLKLGLFTSRFLMGAAGQATADRGATIGRTIRWNDLRDYVRRTVDGDARMLVRREQVPEIDEADLRLPVGEVAALAPAMKAARDDIEWRKAETTAANAPLESYQQQALPYENYLAECERNGCGHGPQADQKLDDIRTRRLVGEDRANWERLRVAGKYREYLDTCVGPCAYRKFAEKEAAIVPPVAPAVPPQASPKPASLSAPRERALKPKESFKECGQCPEMIVAPAGSFTMGSPASEVNRRPHESPQRRVTFSQQFAAGKFAVTVDQFAAFAQETGYDTGSECYTYEDGAWGKRSNRSWRNPGFAQRGSHPVVCVNWDDAEAYVAWLSGKTGKTYRLLSEAEREYVARAGTTTPFWWGSTISTSQANYNSSRKQTMPVGSFQPNPWGLYQVHGNVWEWVEDCYKDSYAGAPTDGSVSTAGDCNRRLHRGGSWHNDSSYLRSADRYARPIDYRDYLLGFRVGRTLLSP